MKLQSSALVKLITFIIKREQMKIGTVSYLDHASHHHDCNVDHRPSIHFAAVIFSNIPVPCLISSQLILHKPRLREVGSYPSHGILGYKWGSRIIQITFMYITPDEYTMMLI